MLPHTVWTDEDDEGWQAVCACGWESRWFRADEYEDTDDPNDAAYDQADAAAKAHES